jgi:hypothetical protein
VTSTLIAVATRKGLWFYRSNDRRTWTVDGPHHFGSNVHHAVIDPRDGRTLLAATRTGHLAGGAIGRQRPHLLADPIMAFVSGPAGVVVTSLADARAPEPAGGTGDVAEAVPPRGRRRFRSPWVQ